MAPKAKWDVIESRWDGDWESVVSGKLGGQQPLQNAGGCWTGAFDIDAD